MKQYINSFMLALSITCSLQASLPVKYWNDNVHKPKSTVQRNISLTEKCKQTVAMIKERKTVNLEKSIPLLMEVYTKEVHTLPEVTLTDKQTNEITKANNWIDYMSKPITCGPLYEVFKNTVNNDPVLQKKNPSLRQTYGYIPAIIGYFIGLLPAYSLLSTIITSPITNTFDDATILHMINH